MGRAPCCDKANVKRGPWSPEEDAKLKEFIHKYGSAGNWIALPQKAGLRRCGKSCRLRWLNYLRPNIKHGEFSDEEDRIICTLYASIGSRWSIIASQLPGRTDNDIKNYWNTKLKKKILGFNFLPSNQPKFPPPFSFPLQTSIPQSQSSLSHLSHLYASIYDQARKSLPSSSDMVNLSPQSFLYSNSSHLLAANHDGGVVPDFHGYYPMKDNMLVFGANEAAASCSSSDGSCSQISYGGGGGKDSVKQEEVGFFQGFIENRSSFVIEESSLGSVLDDHHKLRNGVVGGNSRLQYDLEEVKQLITSGGGGGGDGGGGVNDSLWFGDGSKSGEMGMYYF